jgi:D-glycerate 3-kinase
MRRNASTHTGYPLAVVAATLDALPIARRRTGPLLVGLSGVQGSGKSTLARQLAAAAEARGVRSVVLSLDDFYLGRRERARLAHDVHPLFATRGVPGTHDVELLQHTLDALAHASVRAPVHVPRFDKGRDTRLPPSHWRRIAYAPTLILLEGWCIGVAAQAPATLKLPLNTLERNEDRDGIWRRRVNAELAGRYARLWRRLDRLVLLQAPAFDIVTRWRAEQERARRRRDAPHAMNAVALQRFLQHYERLSRHALRTLPARADVRIVLDEARTVRSVVCTPRRVPFS